MKNYQNAIRRSNQIQHAMNVSKITSRVVKNPQPVVENKEYKKIVIVGAGVAGINAATKLVDNGYPGEYITIID